MLGKLALVIEILFWRILKKSGIFKYWYKKFLTSLLYDLEIFDMEPERITALYKKKLEVAGEL